MSGIDIVRINRIIELIERRGLDFVQNMLNTREESPETLAGIFASKEALGKHLGSGINKNILENSIILKDDKGKPSIIFGKKKYELSISHDGDYAIAIVTGKGGIMVDKDLIKLLPGRPSNANKATFGRLGIVAGQKGMIGCAKLSSRAAMRAGAGYVYLFSEEENKTSLEICLDEEIIMGREDLLFFCTIDALAVGPGIGYSSEEYMKKLFSYIAERNIRTVLDADGLYYLKKFGNIGMNQLIITPHPMEAARLLSKDVSYIMKNRLKSAEEISQKYSCDVIIKGEGSLVYNKNGDYYINESGNNGLATAGTGDVLTGIIGAFLANGCDTYRAGKLGVYFHGLSADIMAQKISKRAMIASDIIEGLKYVFMEEDYA